MAGYRGHIVGGVLCGGAFIGALQAIPEHTLDKSDYVLQDWQLFVGLIVISILFALWPDIDTNSIGQNIFFGLAFVADIILIITGRIEAAAYLGLLAMTPIVGHHRGWTHSKLAMILVPMPIVVIPYLRNHAIWYTGLLIYGAAVAGYFSHLLLDGLVIKSFAVRSPRR